MVKRLTEQRVFIQKQDVARGRVTRIPVSSNQEVPGLSVKRAEVHTPLFGESTSRGEEKVPAIRQELRPAVRSLLLWTRPVRSRPGASRRPPRPGRLRDSLSRSRSCRLRPMSRHEDPRMLPAIECTAPPDHGNLLQPAQIVEKPNPLAVRGPERLRRIFRPGQHSSVNVFPRPQPQCRLASGLGRDKRHRPAIRRHSKLRGGNGGGAMLDERQPFGWIHREANDITRWNDRSSPRRSERKCTQYHGGRRDPRGALRPCVTRASVSAPRRQPDSMRSTRASARRRRLLCHRSSGSFARQRSTT